MASQQKDPKQNAPRGHSRAAQNRKIRREALREELQAREYIRQVLFVSQTASIRRLKASGRLNTSLR